MAWAAWSIGWTLGYCGNPAQHSPLSTRYVFVGQGIVALDLGPRVTGWGGRLNASKSPNNGTPLSNACEECASRLSPPGKS